MVMAVALAGVAALTLLSPRAEAQDTGCSELPTTAELRALRGTEGTLLAVDAPSSYHPGCDTPGDPLTLSVDWGDGTTSAGTLVPTAGDERRFTIHAEHTYLRPTPSGHPAQVVIVQRNDRTGVSRADRHYVAAVGAAAPGLIATMPCLLAGRRFAGVLARVTTAGRRAADELRAMIDWGDGTTTSGRLSHRPGGFAVAGAHRWARGVRRARVTVTVRDTVGRLAASAGRRVRVARGPIA